MHDPYNTLKTVKFEQGRSQAQISSMLQDTSATNYPAGYQPESHKSSSDWVMWWAFSVMLMAGSFLFIGGGACVFLPILAAGIGVAVYANSGLQGVHRENALIDQRNLSQLNHLQRQDHTRLAQRVDAMNALKEYEIARMQNHTSIEVAKIGAYAQVEVAKYQALGVSHDREFEQKFLEFKHNLEAGEAQKERKHQAIESKRVRRHEAIESGKDRELTMNRLVTQLQGKIDVLETRMQYEHPSASVEAIEELARLKGEMVQIKEVEKLKNEDPILYKQVLDRLLANRYKRRG